MAGHAHFLHSLWHNLMIHIRNQLEFEEDEQLSGGSHLGV